MSKTSCCSAQSIDCCDALGGSKTIQACDQAPNAACNPSPNEACCTSSSTAFDPRPSVSCCPEPENTSCFPEPESSTEPIQAVSTTLTFKDYLAATKMRWGIGRMSAAIDPGLYAVGSPYTNSPVLVSANYRLTFDTLRKNLAGLDCWILILDTKGINVWCAAGKGTFGTEELIYRIEEVGLAGVVQHRKLILPQLGAPGVDSHEVARRSGFSVKFGPVRAADIKQYITDSYKVTPTMRTVKFTTRDRLVLTPMEFIPAARYSLAVLGVLFLLNLVAVRPFGALDLVLYLGAIIVGAVITPVLLPIIPGRAFSWKGWLLGLIWTACALWFFGWLAPQSWLLAAGYLLLLPALSAFLAMNFTGASTYTSPTGVLREMRIALPLILVSSSGGAILLLIKTFMG